jgi:hypothetical protein
MALRNNAESVIITSIINGNNRIIPKFEELECVSSDLSENISTVPTRAKAQ